MDKLLREAAAVPYYPARPVLSPQSRSVNIPGAGTPEAGGEDFLSFIKIVKLLKTKKLVGADVVELAPAIDPTGNSEVFAAKVVRELILALHGEGTGHVG
ncbi:MAG: arginase family protein [Proteobacteria bacterium]|nr:arginase family protein [Pseudomonadota bacterium]MBU0968235.1 arginase family protein [Pseudomonadota bacterium]